MALAKTLEVNGVNVPNAYVRVSKYFGTKSQITATVDICANSDTKPIHQQEIQTGIKPDGNNVLSQVYTHLKTTPYFAGATDC
jgi:hypothetical protein